MSAVALLVVTDLDGCLLDADTYAYDAARPALAALARADVPRVLCSGKTRAVMLALARDLGLLHPFIVENGGAIVFPDGSFPGEVPGARAAVGMQVLGLGAPRATLVAALREVAAEAGARVRGFADLGPEEVGRLTGLSDEAARRALERAYDEPFLVEDDEALPRMVRAAEARGLHVGHGGRFHHLMGGSDKGLAVRTLLALYQRAGREFRSAGLGDAETDLSFLRTVDHPIVVPRRNGTVDPALATQLPAAGRAPAPGPVGWNTAVLALLEEDRRPFPGGAPSGGRV